MKNKKLLLVMMTLLVFMLPACKSKADATPTAAPNAVYTSAAQTVAVQLTENALANPSATTTSTNTMIPPTVTIPPSSTVPAATIAPQIIPSATTASTGDLVEYLDQTPTDGTVLPANQSFTVSWTIKNVGKTTWTTGYQVRFFSGDRMGANLSNSYSFSKQVLPGETITVSAEFVAPAKAGDYKSIWVLTNQDGSNFYSVYADIKVGVVAATPTSTTTLTSVPTETPTVTNTP